MLNILVWQKLLTALRDVKMEANYWNVSSSNETGQEALLGSGFTAFAIIASIVLAVIIIIDAFIAIVLLLSTSVAVPVRVLLTNILVANIILAVISLCPTLYSVTLSQVDGIQPSLPYCRFSIYVFTVAIEARLLGLVAFSVMVLKLVVCTTRNIGAKWLACSLLAVWLISFLSRIDTVIPPIFEVEYVGGVACLPKIDSEDTIITLTYSILWAGFALLVPLFVCICISLGLSCYIRRHTISEGAHYKKAMAKFSAFLITGNVLDILSQIVPAVVRRTPNKAVGVYISFSLYLLSFTPTPILIVVFLRPVRKQMHRLFCGKCCKNIESTPMQQVGIDYNRMTL